MNVAGQYNLHRTEEQCCEKHFSYLNTGVCVGNSVKSVETAKETTAEKYDRQYHYYPDIYGRNNCIYFNGYYEWMESTGYSDQYLFNDGAECCDFWYPGREDCPDLSKPTETDINGNPETADGYWYPNTGEGSCQFGRNYPQYMALEGYEQHYLFITPDECCSKFYPDASEDDCPMGPDDGVQSGRYWKSDVYFYPNYDGDWCVEGEIYPEWMADPQYKETHLFGTANTCCEVWFSNDVLECEASIEATDKEEEPKKNWYPTLSYPYECKSDIENIPGWMVGTGFKGFYVFDSKPACCKAYYCSDLN